MLFKDGTSASHFPTVVGHINRRGNRGKRWREGVRVAAAVGDTERKGRQVTDGEPPHVAG